MSVQYAPSKLKVPAGFQNLLEGLAREVLRDQPDEILKFAAEYFKNQLARRDATGRDDAVKGDYMEQLGQGRNVTVPAEHTTPPSDITRDAGTGLILPEQKDEAVAAEVAKPAEEEVDIDLTDPDVEKAAKKIQGVFRKRDSSVKSPTKTKSPTPTPAADPIIENTAEPVPVAQAEDEPSSDLTEDDAAAKIQALARGKKARDEVQAIRDSQTDVTESSEPISDAADVPTEAVAESTDEEKENAAIKIQSAARMKLAKDEVNKIKADQAEVAEPAADEPAAENSEASGLTEEEAAVKIQSVARMRAAKDEVEQMKQASGIEAAPAAEEVAKAPTAAEPTQEELDAAAIKIQASFRGHQARESVKAMAAPAEGDAVPDDDIDIAVEAEEAVVSAEDTAPVEEAATGVEEIAPEAEA